MQISACNFIKREALAQVFFCEFWEILKNSFFTENVRANAPEMGYLTYLFVNKSFWKVISVMNIVKKYQLPLPIFLQRIILRWFLNFWKTSWKTLVLKLIIRELAHNLPWIFSREFSNSLWNIGFKRLRVLSRRSVRKIIENLKKYLVVTKNQFEGYWCWN